LSVTEAKLVKPWASRDERKKHTRDQRNKGGHADRVNGMNTAEQKRKQLMAEKEQIL